MQIVHKYAWKCLKLRSSRPEVLRKNDVFEACFWGLTPATSLKKRLWYRCFPVNFVKFLRTPFVIEHLRWLLLETVVAMPGFSICLITLNIWQGFEYDSGVNMLRYCYNNIIIVVANVITLEFLSARFLHRFFLHL